MKKKSLFAISLMSMALVACSNDEDVNKVIDQENEGGALVTLKLDVAKPQTKGSPGATNKQPGTEAENAIDNVTVVVDYGTEKKYITSTTSNWNATDKELTFKAPEGEATFYVYANVNTADPVGTAWSADLVSAGTTVSDYYKASNFFMSNQNGNGVKHAISSKTSNEVDVNIERAAAKVSVESKADFDDDKFGGTMSAMQFKLGNTASNFYLLQQKTASAATGATYVDLTEWKNVTLDETAYEGEDIKDDISTIPYQYCMENLQANYQQSNTTFIKFNTTFTPGQALAFETATGEGATGLVVKDQLQEVTIPAAGDKPSFYVVLDGRNDLTSNYIMKADLYKDNGVDLKDDVTLKAIDKDGQETTSDIVAYEVEGIEGITKISAEYVNGTCYFGPIWFNINNAGTESPVYRNDWYHLKVTSIKLPGSPQDPDDGGDIPLIPDVNVTVKATVLDWEWEAKEIELQ